MNFIRRPNQQDLSWFLDMDEQKRLDLDPPYQRRSVWTSHDKQDFLDTILNDFPCPAIYIQKESTETGPKFNVVDGKQRLSTVLNFFNGKMRLSKTFSIKALRSKKFKDLPEEYRTKFFNYIFLVEQIRTDSNGQVDWGEVFQRVNKNQKTLKAQELRHARFDGWLITRAEKETDEAPFWKNIGVSSRSRFARMKDVEFVSILMLVILENKFVGFPQWKIDELYAKYDFDKEKLPEDEAAIDYSEEDEVNDFGNITLENITSFEENFTEIREFISKMEEHNSCITNFKKRLFTDLYSLWCGLVFEPKLIQLGANTIAETYASFISQVDEAFVLSKKKGAVMGRIPPTIQKYFGNSTGAATEEKPRKMRNEALIEYLLPQEETKNED